MNQVYLVDPQDIPQVSVSYGDSKFMCGTAFAGTDFYKEMVDLRWNPYHSPTNRWAGERIVVHVNKWFIDPKFHQGLENRVIGQHVWRDGETAEPGIAEEYIGEMNSRLAVMDHFGFDIQYDDKYLAWIADHICDILLDAYRADPDDHMADRNFHHKRYSRKEWVMAFCDFIAKNGI